MGLQPRRSIALLLAGAVAASTAVLAGLVGAVAPAAADVGPVNPVRVPIGTAPSTHPANSGFLVFIEGDVLLNADESEGTVALGGDLSFGTTYNVAAGGGTPTPTFIAPGDTTRTSLYVGGGMDFSQSGGNILRVLNGGYAKVADTSTYLAHELDQNNTPIDWRITQPGESAEATPRVEGTSRQTAASIGTPVPSSLIDIPTAFDTYRGLSTDLGTCPNTVVLTDDPGMPLASPFATGVRGHVSLIPGQTNVLTITAEDLAALGELAFDDQPTLTAPLLVNVTGDSFTGSMPNSPGVTSVHAPSILYNFPTATAITVTGGDSLEGTIYAPRADVQWRVTQNIEGNVIGAAFTHGPGGPKGAIPREVHDLPFAAQLSCSTTPTQAELTLVKVVEGGNAVPGDWVLSADGPTPVTGASGESSVTDAVVDPGGYTLSEAGGPADYTAGDWSCVGADVVDGVVSVGAGDDVTCTIVNTFSPPGAELTLVKVVEGGDAVPGDWVLSADGPTPVTGASGESSVTDAVVDPGGYTLSEAGGPADYTAGDWSCVGADVVDGVVSVGAGDDATCTIVNTFSPPGAELTLIKIVSGGTASPTDWVLTAEGPTPIAGTTGSVAVTSAEVLPGEYVLSESDGPDGYEAGDWVCTGATVVVDTVTVDWGDDVSCSIINMKSGGTGGSGGGGGDGGGSGGDGGGSGGGGNGNGDGGGGSGRGGGTGTTAGGGSSYLAATGVDPYGSAGVALGLALLGATLLGAARVRRGSTAVR